MSPESWPEQEGPPEDRGYSRSHHEAACHGRHAGCRHGAAELTPELLILGRAERNARSRYTAHRRGRRR